MKANSFISKVDSRLALVLIIYSVLGLFLLRHYQYQINPDGVSYISIAQKYARGDFCDAINGYWGPLISWLLAPFLFFGLPPLFAFKILSLIIGALTLIGTRSLSYRFEMEERIRSVILFSLIPIILFFSLGLVTPDLLLTCILVFYLTIIFKTDYPGAAGNGVLCGALGSVAYLCKAYAFPFFISHFLLCNVIHYLRSETKESKRGVLRNLVLGVACFSVVSAGWIYLISNKYNMLTFGTAGTYNHLLHGPESQGHPMIRQGFLKPPNKTAISAWEDPSYLIPKMKPWSPMDSRAHFKYQARRTLKNVHRICNKYKVFSFLSIVIILSYILLCIKPFNKTILQKDSLFPLVTIMLYPIGYALLRVRERFLWLVYILLILMSGHLLNLLFRNDFLDDTRKKIVLMLFAMSFLPLPLMQLVKNINIDKDTYSLSKILERKYNIRGNIASNDCWKETLHLSFYLNSQYYGIPRQDDISNEDLANDLKKYNIDYYFVWNKRELLAVPYIRHDFARAAYHDDFQFLSNFKEETGGGIPGLSIYNMRNDE